MYAHIQRTLKQNSNRTTARHQQDNSGIYMEMQRNWNRQNNFEKEQNCRTHNFKTHYKTVFHAVLLQKVKG